MTTLSSSCTESAESQRHQVQEKSSPVLKTLLLLAGTLSLGLGLIGILLPLLPTTPFFLLTAICYSRSSERFYVALLNNRYVGRYIRDWRENKGLTRAMKLWVLTVLYTTMGLSVFFFIPLRSIQIFCVLTALCVTAYLWSLPTKSAVSLIEKARD